jgi:type 1 glutamine amidotransferase
MKTRLTQKFLIPAIVTVLALLISGVQSFALPRHPSFGVLVLASKDPDHSKMIDRAEPLLYKLAEDNGFSVDFSRDTRVLTDSNLVRFQVIVQLHQAPFELSPSQQAAVERFVEQGKGWVGIHAAGLTGRQFIDSTTAYWQWFEDFFGGVVYSPHPSIQSGTVHVENHSHPATRNLPDDFTITDEWYEFNQSPRPNVRVLATANESTYRQNKPMGDHPIVWTNEKYERMIYIGVGHDASAVENPAFVTLLRDAIMWAATPGPWRLKQESKPKGNVIYHNQVGYDARGPKIAVVGSTTGTKRRLAFSVVNVAESTVEYSGVSTSSVAMPDWVPGGRYYRIDFSPLVKPGRYRICLDKDTSGVFVISDNALAALTLPAIVHYYTKQRANTERELAVDSQLPLFGSSDRVDMRGGWCDAGGDVSKYFSHLAYANVMSPQQTPLVAWSLAGAAESAPRLIGNRGLADSLMDEALWGADYMMRALSPEGYFRMIVFSYFNKDPHARQVVGLLANSVTTADYQCAFREGGGMAIAALARISRWKRNGAYTSADYLSGAKRAFDHLLHNNTRYDDDGKENIIDDYCALMAASELWIATDSSLYRDEARKRAANLSRRMTPGGYFSSDDSGRPFWHASDAGLPVISLARYVTKETSPSYRANALATIKRWLDYTLAVTYRVDNPFGYARQTFRVGGKIKEGFFIPHENETGWWWQGENARLGSLAAAALVGGRLVYPGSGGWGVKDSLALFASEQLSWILGCNPYALCFLYGFGEHNVRPMTSQFGHGSERGGISNGITGKKGHEDGSGIDFRQFDDGNEWRWTEQWIPHAAWFLQAIMATAEPHGANQAQGEQTR